MKGAKALPAVRVMIRPSISKSRISGRSQNFFRTFKKPHRSRTTDTYLMANLSEDLSIPLDRGLARLLVDPVGPLSVLPLQVERSLPQNTHGQADGGQDEKEERGKDHAGHHEGEALGELHPQLEKSEPQAAQNESAEER